MSQVDTVDYGKHQIYLLIIIPTDFGYKAFGFQLCFYSLNDVRI